MNMKASLIHYFTTLQPATACFRAAIDNKLRVMHGLNRRSDDDLSNKFCLKKNIDKYYLYFREILIMWNIRVHKRNKDFILLDDIGNYSWEIS